MIDEEGKAGQKLGEEWSAILVPSPAASNSGRRYGLLPGSDGLSYDALKASAFEYQDLKAALALASE